MPFFLSFFSFLIEGEWGGRLLENEKVLDFYLKKCTNFIYFWMYLQILRSANKNDFVNASENSPHPLT